MLNLSDKRLQELKEQIRQDGGRDRTAAALARLYLEEFICEIEALRVENAELRARPECPLGLPGRTTK